MNEKIAILGANSYIGRNLLLLLRDKGFRPALYDYTPAHIDGGDSYRQVDLLNRDSVSHIDFTADVFYYFTGLTGTAQGFDDYALYLDVNEKMLLSFLTAYKEKNAHGRVVFLSTRLVYKGNSRPLREEDEKQFNSIYAVNKYACEQYLALYGQQFGIPYTILRLCVPYGNRAGDAQSYGTIGFFERRARAGENIPLYGDGALRRTFTHIDDLCDILYLSAHHPACAQHVLNVGGQALSLLQAAEWVAARYGVGVTFTEWPTQALKMETGDTVFDSQKLDDILHYPYQKMIASERL